MELSLKNNTALSFKIALHSQWEGYFYSGCYGLMDRTILLIFNKISARNLVKWHIFVTLKVTTKQLSWKIKPLDQRRLIDAHKLNHTAKVIKKFVPQGSILEQLMRHISKSFTLLIQFLAQKWKKLILRKR